MAGKEKKVEKAAPAPAAKAVNAGPERGNNAFPASNKGKPNHSGRGGGGPAGDGAHRAGQKKA
ncbi:MAG: hypothetical protein NT117_08895 [Gammaproteobacteria bacterium]|nr:hypothetical protein [Gammaproteobacteria bacterium]